MRVPAAASPRAFDDLAEAYDRYRTGYAPELYDVLEESGLRAGTHVLDVACGTGLAAGALVARGIRVTGIDLSEPMLAAARTRVPGATFVAGRAEELPFADDSFDAATCAQAYHWFDADAALREAMRVVRPGGVVAVWWKELLRGDTIQLTREDAYREVGIDGTLRAVPSDDFRAFERSALVEQRLRVIPWIAHTTVREFVGYERSRARARAAFGTHLDAYIEALERRLGPAGTPLALAYVHLLYLGRVPSGGS